MAFAVQQHSCSKLIRSGPARALASPHHPACSFRGATAPRRRSGRRSPAVVQAASGGKYPSWDVIYAELARAQTVTLQPEDAFDAVELGRAVLIDCRPAEDFEKAHPRGAVHVPAFVVMESPSSPGEWAKWLACKANGVTCTVPNAEMAAAVAAAAAGGKAVRGGARLGSQLWGVGSCGVQPCRNSLFLPPIGGLHC